MRFRPEARSLYHTHGNSAFTGEQASTRALDDDEGNDDDYEAEVADMGLGAGPVSAAAAATLPSDFPPHRALELGKFLASSSYIVSLGGPPLPDLRYGIVIVPVGEESMVFRGYGDHAALPPGFKEQVYAKSKEAKKEQGVEHWMNERGEAQRFRVGGGAGRGGEGLLPPEMARPRGSAGPHARARRT